MGERDFVGAVVLAERHVTDFGVGADRVAFRFHQHLQHLAPAGLIKDDCYAYRLLKTPSAIEYPAISSNVSPPCHPAPSLDVNLELTHAQGKNRSVRRP
jgi:hypothetical protein